MKAFRIKPINQKVNLTLSNFIFSKNKNFGFVGYFHLSERGSNELYSRRMQVKRRFQSLHKSDKKLHPSHTSPVDNLTHPVSCI